MNSRAIGATRACALVLAACGSKSATTTVTVVGTVPNGGATSVSNTVAAGGHDFVQFACAQCHGGGIPKPQSPDKSIPPLSGADFFHEFNTDWKVIDVIRSGSVIGRAPIVSMPHWGGIIPDDRLKALVAYIKTLKSG